MHGFKVWRVLGRGASIFVDNLVPFLGLGLLVYSPLLVYATVLLASPTLTLGAIEVFSWVSAGASVFLPSVASAVVISGVLERLRGRPVSLRACLRAARARLIPVLAVAALSLVAIAFGLLFLIVPGIVVACSLWVVMPVAVTERVGLMASLDRSWHLTHGHKLGIFGIFLLLGVVSGGAGYLVAEGFGIHGSHPGQLALKGYLVVSLLLDVALVALGAVVCAVGYHHLRLEKDGTDLTEVDAVFA